jgi:hypothetical protein
LSVLNCLWKRCLLQQGPRTSRSDPAAAAGRQAARVTSPSLTIVAIYPAHHLHPSSESRPERPRAPHDVRPPAPGDRSSHGDQIGRSSEWLICVADDWACMQGEAHRARTSKATTGLPCNFSPSRAVAFTGGICAVQICGRMKQARRTVWRALTSLVLVRAKKREAMQTIGRYQENMHAHTTILVVVYYKTERHRDK